MKCINRNNGGWSEILYINDNYEKVEFNFKLFNFKQKNGTILIDDKGLKYNEIFFEGCVFIDFCLFYFF